MECADLGPWRDPLRVTLGTEPEDREWDDFLESTPLGQFQQSSRWGCVKTCEGWTTLRIKLHSIDGLQGGAQLLVKKSRLGRVGYISKGPVLRSEKPDHIAVALRKMTQTARRLRLASLIVQPPDFSRITGADFRGAEFAEVVVPGIIDATLLLDVSAEPAVIEHRMSARLRAESRQAVRRGVLVEQGSGSDAAAFFDLMLCTCQRQGASPNPANAFVLKTILDQFFPRAHLWFASRNGRRVAGLLLIGFGDRLILWKKGWMPEGKEAHPNVLLHTKVIQWAHEQGYRQCDFAAVDRDIAETLLAGKQLSERQLKTRHTFNLRLGAQPQLLPQARMFVVNPLFRVLFNKFGRSDLGHYLLTKVTRTSH